MLVDRALPCASTTSQGSSREVKREWLSTSGAVAVLGSSRETRFAWLMTRNGHSRRPRLIGVCRRVRGSRVPGTDPCRAGGRGPERTAAGGIGPGNFPDRAELPAQLDGPREPVHVPAAIAGADEFAGRVRVAGSRSHSLAGKAWEATSARSSSPSAERTAWPSRPGLAPRSRADGKWLPSSRNGQAIP